jgi:hypothetical protein
LAKKNEKSLKKKAIADLKVVMMYIMIAHHNYHHCSSSLASTSISSPTTLCLSSLSTALLIIISYHHCHHHHHHHHHLSHVDYSFIITITQHNHLHQSYCLGNEWSVDTRDSKSRLDRWCQWGAYIYWY